MDNAISSGRFCTTFDKNLKTILNDILQYQFPDLNFWYHKKETLYLYKTNTDVHIIV